MQTKMRIRAIFDADYASTLELHNMNYTTTIVYS